MILSGLIYFLAMKSSLLLRLLVQLKKDNFVDKITTEKIKIKFGIKLINLLKFLLEGIFLKIFSKIFVINNSKNGKSIHNSINLFII